MQPRVVTLVHNGEASVATHAHNEEVRCDVCRDILMASKIAATSRNPCSYTQLPTKIAKRGLGACRHALKVFIDTCQVST